MKRLKYVLNFNDNDLAANRTGQFSPLQIQRLEQAQSRSMPVFWSMCILVFVMLAIALLFGGFNLLAIFAPIPAAYALIEYFLSYRAYHRDLRYGVESVQGQLHFLQPKDALLSAERSPVGIRIGDVSFLLLPHQVDAFHEDDIYILYYAPATNSLLAAENVMSYDSQYSEYYVSDMIDNRNAHDAMRLKQNRGQ